ncbi:hypothetical protein [Kitasatospora sp. NBC_01302]|uniref:hypothetical protein n=1 Tax=Kitasatospora sp. NBC_01302 TaxID=2903575 RepID=UPI002E101A7D|nr:hypothetical protein OG294_40590 [Kitasatospora sp. NBC_01302]
MDFDQGIERLLPLFKATLHGIRQEPVLDLGAELIDLPGGKAHVGVGPGDVGALALPAALARGALGLGLGLPS